MKHVKEWTRTSVVALVATVLLQLLFASQVSMGMSAKGSEATATTASKSTLKFGWGGKYLSNKTTTVGRSIKVRGRLVVNGKPASNVTVSIKRRTRVPGSEWEDVADVVTDSQGRFKQSVGKVPSSTFTATYADVATGKSTNKSARLFVRPRIIFSVFPRRLRNGQRVVLKGTLLTKVSEISPKGKNVTIKFRDTSSGRASWRAFSVRKTDKKGDFRTTHKFLRVTKPTRFRFRVDVPAEFAWPFSTAKSRVVSVVVRPRS